MDFLVMSKNKKIFDYPMHAHEYWEILYNIEGSGSAVIGEASYDFCPGTIFCIRPQVSHGKKAARGFADASILCNHFCLSSEPGDVIIFQDDERRSFGTLLKMAYDFPLNPAEDIYGERFLCSLFDAMQNLLSHWMSDTAKDPEVLRVQKILGDHVRDTDFDLETLLRKTSYSPNYFRKLFKAQCGCSPLQYYNMLKIQRARQQIIQNKAFMTVSEIAADCGFEDQFYFSRVFKKMTGMSPMQYYKRSTGTIPTPED